MAQLVRVEWVDSAHIRQPWAAKDETLSPVRCVSVGYVVERTKRKIVLAGDYTNDQHGRLIAIPATAIRRVKRLRG